MPVGGKDMVDAETVEVSTGDDIQLGVIWLHGLGADGHDFEPIVGQLTLPFAARFIFPHAALRPVTINGGMRMRAWYDIVSIDSAGPEDAEGIAASATLVSALIDRELERGLKSERIVLAGFSQGSVIAMHCALRESRRLAGLMVLSGYLALPDSLQTDRNPANADIDIWMAHGRDDQVIDIRLAEKSRDRLLEANYTVAWRTYPMGHAVCSEQIADISAWLGRC